jgi:hypothetical protein
MANVSDIEEYGRAVVDELTRTANETARQQPVRRGLPKPTGSKGWHSTIRDRVQTPPLSGSRSESICTRQYAYRETAPGGGKK